MDTEVANIHNTTIDHREEREVARFKKGWVKAWRDTLDEDLPGNICLWALWHWLLLNATWKSTKIIWKGKQREIPPGTVVMTPKELSDRWGCSKNTIWKWMRYLQDSERIVIESCTRGTLVTIRNWSEFQGKDQSEWTPTGHEVDTKCTPTGHEVDISKEDKKEELRNLSLSISLSYEKLEREILEKFPNDAHRLRRAYEYFERTKKDLRGNPIGSTIGLIRSSWSSVREEFPDLERKEDRTKKCAHKYWDTDPYTGTAKCVACKFEIVRAAQ